MINEIRHRLVLKYTVVIALVLLGLSLLSYFMQKMSNCCRREKSKLG